MGAEHSLLNEFKIKKMYLNLLNVYETGKCFPETMFFSFAEFFKIKRRNNNLVFFIVIETKYS